MKFTLWLKLLFGFKDWRVAAANLADYGGQGRDKFGN